MRKRINKILWHGDELLEEKAKAPGIATSADGLDGLNEGEIYISNNEKDPALFIRTSSGKVVRVGVNYEELKKLFLSKTDDDTAEGVITFNKGMKLPAGEQTVWYKDFDISSIEIITKGVGIFADSTDAEQFGEMVGTDADMVSTDFIDLQKANYIDISLLAAKDEASRMGLVFYNAENAPIKGYYISGQEEDGYVSRKIAVPEGATQIRFSAWSIADETLYLKLGYFADAVNTSLISSLIKADDMESAEFSENSLITAAAFAKLFKLAKDDKGNFYIRTPYPLASDKTVSSLGIGKEGAGEVSAISALYKLVDVLRDDENDRVSGAEDGNVLMFDAATGKWYGKKVNLPDVDLTEVNGKIDGLQRQLDTLVSGDASDAIDTFNNVVAFLKDIEDTDTLEGILAGKQNKITETNKLDYSLLANTPLLADFMGSSAIGGTASSDNFSAVYWDGKQWQTRTIYKWALASEKPSYTTSEVTEGENLYFTDQRAITALEDITRDLSDRIAAYEKVLKIEDNGKLLHALVSFASDKTVSSLGIGSSEGGGVSYNRLDSWDSYTDDKAGYVLSAALGWDLKDRLDNLDFGDFDLSGYQPLITTDNKLSSSLVSGLATVATSGKYSDLSGVPTKLSDFTDDIVNGKYQPLIDTTNKLAYSLLDGTPTALKNPNALKFGNKSYDGSEEKIITAADLGAFTEHQAIYALTVKDSAGTTKLTYTPNDKASEITLTKAMVGLGDVENTKLSTWAGTSNITTIGTITTGTWNATKIANDYIANPHVTIAGNKVNLGGTLSVDTLQTSLDIVTRSTDQEITGKKTFSKRTIFKDGIQIGNSEAYIYWDADKNVLRTNVSFASDSTVSSLGVGSDGNGGVSYDRLDSWDNYDAGAGAVLSATLGYELKQAIENIDLGDFNLTAYLTKEEASKTYATQKSLSGYQPLITTNNSLEASLVSGLATVATSGNYRDLSGLPTLGTLASKNTLAASDIPSLSWNKITSDKPTTLSGYGITDALPLSGGTIDGVVTFDNYTNSYSYISFKNNRVGSEGYADEVVIFTDGSGNAVGRLGMYGAGAVSYYYLGHNAYNGDNLRVYADKLTFGNNIVLHSGNYTDYALSKNGGTISGDLTVTGSLNMGGNIYIPNANIIYSKDTGGTGRNIIELSITNNLHIGYGTSLVGYSTYINGNNVLLRYGTSQNTGIFLNYLGNVTIGSSDLATTNYKLYVEGNSKVSGTLDVGSTTILGDKLTIRSGGMSVTGTAYFGGGTSYYFGSTGNVSANTLTAAGATSLKSTLAVTGATTLSSTLGVSGVATFNSNIKAEGYIYFGTNDDAYIYWDAGKKVLRTNVSFASDKTVSSLGVGTDDGGGGSADWGAVPTSIIPTVNGEYNLGDNSKMWNTLYVQQGFIGSIISTSSYVTISSAVSGNGNTWQIGSNGAASFSSLIIGGNAAATQAFVTSQGYMKFTDVTGLIEEYAQDNINGKYLLVSGGTLYNVNSELPLHIKGGSTGAYIGFKLSNNTDIGYIGVNDTKDLIFGFNKVLHSGNTSFSAALTTGTKIGTINIGGTTTDLYAPVGGGDTSGLQSQIDELDRNLSGLTDSYNDLNSIVEDIDKNKLFAKVDKVSGKGLSTNDFTATYKTSLDNLTSATGLASGYIKKLKADTFDLGGSTVVTTDDLATVATSGSYNDLTNKPTIPSAITVTNNLTSTSTSAALSANQGRVLNNKFADYLSLADGGTMSGYTEFRAGIGVYGLTYPALRFVYANTNNTAWLAYGGGSTWLVTNSSWAAEYTLIHSGNIGSQSVSYATSAGSADKLSTARTIWGHSFDGTGNVSGNLTSVGNIQFLRDNSYVIGESAKQALYVYAGWFGSGSGKSLSFGANDGYCIHVNASNNITIGSSNGSNDLATTNYKLYVNGNTYISGSLNYASDEKLKAKVSDVRLSLSSMAYAPLIQFAWKNGIDSRLHVGTIAQYWESVLPEVISTTSNDTLALAYGELGVAMGISLATHLTETNDEVSKLKKRVEELENENKRLQERVDALVA